MMHRKKISTYEKLNYQELEYEKKSILEEKKEKVNFLNDFDTKILNLKKNYLETLSSDAFAYLKKNIVRKYILEKKFFNDYLKLDLFISDNHKKEFFKKYKEAANKSNKFLIELNNLAFEGLFRKVQFEWIGYGEFTDIKKMTYTTKIKLKDDANTSIDIPKDFIKELKISENNTSLNFLAHKDIKEFHEGYLYNIVENDSIQKKDYNIEKASNYYTTNSLNFFREFHENCFKEDNIKAKYHHFTKIPSKKYYEDIFLDEEENLNNRLRKIELLQRRLIKSKEKIENIGYVYVLSNNAYPGIYKIGSTYGLPEERAEELTGTGHLESFKVIAKSKIQSAEYYEKLIHRFLADYRVKQNREFFKLDIKDIKYCIKHIEILSENGSKKITLNILKEKIKFN